MEVIVASDSAEIGSLAADLVQAAAARPGVVLGFATGSSPGAIYRELAARVAGGRIDLSGATGFALDEYVGLPPGHPESYAATIERTVTGPLGMAPERMHVPAGGTDDLPAVCSAYEDAIREAGGIDLQLLGIGANGHIAFNEPGSPLDSRTRMVALATGTRADNARFFPSPDDVPHHALTQGIGTILEARRLLLVAQGEHKAPAVALAIDGPVAMSCPASALQLHPNATVILDEAAASALTAAGYFRYARENKLVRAPIR